MESASSASAEHAITAIVPRKPTPGEADQEAERLRQEQEDYLDEALEETFPASDPIAPGRPHSKTVTEIRSKPAHRQGIQR